MRVSQKTSFLVSSSLPSHSSRIGIHNPYSFIFSPLSNTRGRPYSTTTSKFAAGESTRHATRENFVRRNRKKSRSRHSTAYVRLDHLKKREKTGDDSKTMYGYSADYYSTGGRGRGGGYQGGYGNERHYDPSGYVAPPKKHKKDRTLTGGLGVRFETVNTSEIDKNAEKQVVSLLMKGLGTQAEMPSVEAEPVPKTLLKRATLRFPFTTSAGERLELLAIGQSTKTKTAKMLCYMHAARLIDYYSLTNRSASAPPLPLQEIMLVGGAVPPPDPSDFSDYEMFVEGCKAYLEQNGNNELLLLEHHIIPPSVNPLVNETAKEIYRRRCTRGTSPDRGSLTKLEGKISGAGKEMHVSRIATKVHVATLTLDAEANLRATGVSSNAKDAKQFCAEHALLLLNKLKAQGAPGGAAPGNDAMPDSTVGGASLSSVISTLNPRYSNLYSFFRFLFDKEEPELSFSKRKDPETNKEYYYCQVKLSDVSCEGKGINRFEAERAAIEIALSQMELYDERIQSLNTFLAKHPHVTAESIPTASLPSSLTTRITAFVKDAKASAEASTTGGAGEDGMNRLTAEERRLNGVIQQQERNPSYAASLQENLARLRAHEVYLRDFHPRRSTLAMWGVRQQLLDYLDGGERVIVVCGTTGCGKTTQVPQYIFDHEIESGRGDVCNILISQPRRLSTFSVAARIAQERLTTVGSEIGYAIRFDSRIGKHLNLCTSGVLLQILSSQPNLTSVTHLIIDEVHERDVNCDVLLALLKGVLETNPTIKVILMSATLQSDLFSTYFNGAPIINVEGAVYPVQEVYLEDIAQNALHTLGSERSPFTFTRGAAGLLSVPNSFMFETLEQQERGLYGNQRRQFRDLQKSPKTDYYLIAYLIYRSIVCDLKGDVAGKSILVFVPGWKELLAAKQALENVASRNPYGVLLNGQPLRFSIILLHSSVDPQKQRECFSPAPPGHIKVVFATNIAESGITIDDAAVVIDTGLIKQTSWVRSSGAGGGRYFPGQDAAGAGDSYGQFSTQLSLQFASKANCIQRKGRAGRTQGGICYRLFTRLTWSVLPEYQRAEIHRVPLTQVLLKLLSLGYAEPKKTLQTFLEPPSTQNVGFSMQLLKHLGAVDTTERLTTLGLYLSKLPCDPRVGKMIMMGALLHCLDSVLTVAAAADLTPYATQRELALEIRKKRYLFARGSQSDHISALNAYNTFCVNMENYQFARHHHLHPHNMQLISKYKWQYRDILLQSGLISGSEVNSVAPAFLLNSAGDHNEKKNGGSPTGIVEDDNVFSPNSYGDANAFDDIGSTYSGDYTNAHQSVYPGQLCVDTSILSEESMDVSLVKACVCAALFPHIAILDPTAPTLGKKKEARKVKLRTKVHASITPSNESACRRVGGPATPESGRPSKQEYMQELVSGGTETKKPPPAMFYVYQDIFTVEEARRSFLTNVSSVSLWALLLFGAGEAQVEYDATLSLCCVDQWIYIRIPSETFHAITSLRECFHACMWRKYNCPSDHTNNAMLEQVRQFSKEVLRAPPVTSNEGDNLAEERETAMYYHRLVDSGSIIPPLIHMNRIGGGQGTSLDHNEDCIREDENNSFDDDWSDDG